MADYDSQLPVRSKQDAHERVQVKIVDETTPTQQMTVDSDKNAHVEVHGNKPTSGNDVTLMLSELGAPNTDGVYHAANNTDPANTGLVGHVRAATPADTDLTNRITSKTGTVDTTVHALDVALNDSNGNNISATNPLPVYISELASGDEVFHFETESAIAKDASSNHSYTPSAGKSFAFQQVTASASGRIKVEVKWGVTGAEALKLVFFTSTANPNVIYTFAAPQLLTDADSVVIVLTNKDNATMDMYSSIEGVEY